MIKRVVIAGGRNYTDYNEAEAFVDRCLEKLKGNEIIIVSGGCRGADTIGEKYAIKNGFRIERHPADWSKYGKSAGPIRNKAMAVVADLVICFWDGKSKGTKSMIYYAKSCGKPVCVKRID